MKIPSQKQLDKWLREWQKILRLQDWDIEIGYARYAQMTSTSVQAECAIQASNKTGSIKILHPTDYKASWKDKQEIVRSIVHELLHFHLDPLDVPKDRDRELEQAIECVEPALTGLYGMVRAQAANSKTSLILTQ